MKFPWRKKEESLDEEEKEEITNEVTSKPADLPKSDNRVDRLEVEIERLKAVLSTSKEFQKAMEERFSRISESIGELRASLIEREKQMKDLEIAALKSTDIINEVQPEKLMLEVRKAGTKTEILQGKLDSYDNLISNIIEEIKAIRRLTIEFEGTEGIRDLNREVRSELGEIKRRESKIEIESSKVGKIFEEMQKKYEEQQEIKSLLNEVITENALLKKEQDAVNIRFASLLDKEEMVKLREEIRELLAESGVSQYKQKSLLEKAQDITQNAIKKGKESFTSKKSQESTRTIPVPGTHVPSTISEDTISNDSLRRQEEKVEKFIAEMERELGNTKSRIKELERYIAATYRDPANPLYGKLKEEIFKKLSYYDAFLSDALTKIPLLEREVLTLNEQLKLIIAKNQEFINIVKTKEVLDLNPQELVKKDALEPIRDHLSLLELKNRETQENLHAIFADINKRLHELSYALNEKEEKQALQEFKETLSKKMHELSYALNEKEGKQNLQDIFADINKRLHELSYALNEKEEKQALQEFKETLSTRLRRNEMALHSLEENFNAILNTASYHEIPRLREEIQRMKALLRDLIERDEEWMNSVFKLIGR